MKRLLKFLAFIMCVTLLLSLTACGPFMSASEVKRAVKEFGTPQAQMTLSFGTSKGTKFKYVITYDLLLEKAPLTTINFINLVESDFYKNAIFERYDTANNYYLAGSYVYRKNDDSSNLRGYENPSSISIPGEFKNNNYSEPNGGYEQFSLLSLAMYHDDNVESFDSANGALIVSMASSSSESKKSLNYTNYTVFARMHSISIYVNDNDTPIYSGNEIGPIYLENMTKSSSTTSCSMTKSSGETSSVTILGSSSVPRFIFSIEMLGDADWSKLPKVD